MRKLKSVKIQDKDITKLARRSVKNLDQKREAYLTAIEEEVLKYREVFDIREGKAVLKNYEQGLLYKSLLEDVVVIFKKFNSYNIVHEHLDAHHTARSNCPWCVLYGELEALIELYSEKL